MPIPENKNASALRLVLSSAALAIAGVAAVVFALLNLPQVLVLGLSLLAALALIDVAAILSTGHDPAAADAPADPRTR